MNKIKQGQHDGGQHREGSHPRGQGRNRLHHHWYFWVGMLLMVAALVIYIMTEDLAWVPGSQPSQPLTGVERP